ncbi:hypothetical protein AB838_10140 [Rhodobacteraceae bacterium (ex Bugula neritina AB1)]|nr:hypothetical protein AB838_10140 [Rhodobacteraceae bacterium (ex Bugula neritina AB1)]
MKRRLCAFALIFALTALATPAFAQKQDDRPVGVGTAKVNPNSGKGALRINLRWMNIDGDATLNGAAISTAGIDPLVVKSAFVHRF